jgi:hypothetical protein
MEFSPIDVDDDEEEDAASESMARSTCARVSSSASIPRRVVSAMVKISCKLELEDDDDDDDARTDATRRCVRCG